MWASGVFNSTCESYRARNTEQGTLLEDGLDYGENNAGRLLPHPTRTFWTTNEMTETLKRKTHAYDREALPKKVKRNAKSVAH